MAFPIRTFVRRLFPDWLFPGRQRRIPPPLDVEAIYLRSISFVSPAVASVMMVSADVIDAIMYEAKMVGVSLVSPAVSNVNLIVERQLRVSMETPLIVGVEMYAAELIDISLIEE